MWLILGVGIALSLLAAGVFSYYASSSPDGLEKVAQEHGFSDTAADSANAALPTAGYGVDGVASERLSVGLAGVLGVIVVIIVAFGLFWMLGRGKSTTKSEESVNS